jgi:hypothetical protein
LERDEGGTRHDPLLRLVPVAGCLAQGATFEATCSPIAGETRGQRTPASHLHVTLLMSSILNEAAAIVCQLNDRPQWPLG